MTDTRCMNAIRDYRERHGLTLEQFGALVGATKATVSKWERGLSGPSLNKAREIEEKVGVPKEATRPDIWTAPHEAAE